MLRVALPKGRMSDESVAFFSERKVSSLSKFPSSRKLIFTDEEAQIEFLLVRSKDVGTYVEQGACDFGVMGYDLLAEHDFDLLVPGELPFGECELCVAYAAENPDWAKRRNIKVATKYPRLTSRYFFEHGFNIQIIELYGSIEIAPLTGISDAIVDLVSTGMTLKENNLIKGETIIQSSARLVLNKSSYAFKNREIGDILDKLL